MALPLEMKSASGEKEWDSLQKMAVLEHGIFSAALFGHGGQDKIFCEQAPADSKKEAKADELDESHFRSDLPVALFFLQMVCREDGIVMLPKNHTNATVS